MCATGRALDAARCNNPAIRLELEREFATIEKLLESGLDTAFTDSLILSWVKYEKQLRRLFSFLVYQSHKGYKQTSEVDRKSIDTEIAANNKIYPHSIDLEISKFGVPSISEILGVNHAPLTAKIKVINCNRNKIMHGQLTDDRLNCPELLSDIHVLVEWISLLADAAQDAYGYDGLTRKTFKAACSRGKTVEVYRFESVQKLIECIRGINHKKPKDCP